MEVLRRIRRTSQVPVIILTGETDELAKVEALDIGADDYVTKPFGRQELLARIRAVVRRGDVAARTLPEQPIRVGTLELDPGLFEATVDGAPVVLTKTEFLLLATLVSAGGRVVPHAKLLTAGWPGVVDPDPQWLKPHLARLRAKLLEAGGPAPVSVRGVGYRLAEGGGSAG